MLVTEYTSALSELRPRLSTVYPFYGQAGDGGGIQGPAQVAAGLPYSELRYAMSAGTCKLGKCG